MERREFIAMAFAATALVRRGAAAGAQRTGTQDSKEGEVVIERSVAGKPHAGKVLAAIQPHSDDISIFASGTVAKLIEEGYAGYLVRVTNDDMAGPGTIGETVLANERDNQEVARILGCQRVFDLNYNNHLMDEVSPIELRARFIFLFRLLKVDTIVCYDPSGHYEENPDHYVTARAVESACWMAGMTKDYPEHFAARLEPHGVQEKYYFARGPQLVNRVVDISSTIEKKIDCLCANKAQGPGGEAGARLRASLAARKLRLPFLGPDDRTANREYARHFLLKDNEEVGRKYGLKYAEQFHYIGPKDSGLEDDIKKNTEPLR